MSRGDNEPQALKVSVAQDHNTQETRKPSEAKGQNDLKPQALQTPETQVNKDPEPKPQPTAAPVAQNKPVRPKLMDSVSIKSVGEVKLSPVAPKVDVKPLTQEDLERYWNEVATELELTEVMKNATVRMSEHTGCFEVDAQTTYFADEFRSHKIDVLEAMRKKTGMGMLNCKVNPMFVEQEYKAYNPDDKYSAMLKSNPHLASLRHLFSDIDY